jgi:topoisomerase-4 subunit A
MGSFQKDDKILALYKNGEYRLHGYEITTHFDDDLLHLEKFDEDKVWNVVYVEGSSGFPYLKRFQFDPTEKRTSFIGDDNSEFLSFNCDHEPDMKLIFDPKNGPKNREEEELNTAEFIAVKGLGAKGKRLSKYPLKNVEWIPVESEESENDEQDSASTVSEVDDENKIEETGVEPSAKKAGEVKPKSSGNLSQKGKSMDDDSPLQMELDI